MVTEEICLHFSLNSLSEIDVQNRWESSFLKQLILAMSACMLSSVLSGSLCHPLAGVGKFENSRISKCNRVISNLSAFGGSPEAGNNISPSSSQITRFDLSCASLVEFFFTVFSNVSGWIEKRKNCFKTLAPSRMSNRASLRSLW